MPFLLAVLVGVVLMTVIVQRLEKLRRDQSLVMVEQDVTRFLVRALIRASAFFSPAGFGHQALGRSTPISLLIGLLFSRSHQQRKGERAGRAVSSSRQAAGP